MSPPALPRISSETRFRCWVEIDLEAIRANLAAAADAAGPGSSVMAVVKADAYGHGAAPVARALAPGAAAFAVATLAEAIELREAGIDHPIALLSPVLPEERGPVIRSGFGPPISSISEARAFSDEGERIGRDVAAHLVVDTGMGRIGILESDAEGAALEIASLPRLRIEALASHFPSADEDETFTREQLRRFTDLVRRLESRGVRPRFVHIANSAGVLAYKGAPLTMCRPGLMLYGESPLPDLQSRLRRALTFRSRVVLVRTVPAGHSISYGRTFITERATRVATIAAGYGDGYPRHLSGAGAAVLIRGRRCPLLGRVTMDQVMADVSELGGDVRDGDEVTLLGRDGDEEVSATELARRAGTIPWEIFTGITARPERVYIG